MNRIKLTLTSLLIAGLSACAPGDLDEREAEAALADHAEHDDEGGEQSGHAELLGVTRARITGDVFHTTFTLRVGSTPNAKVRLHRVTRERGHGRPRPSSSAIMLMHGDFADFTTNFALGALGQEQPPHGGLAVYLAKKGIDVWGMDRRYTLAPREGADLSDFGAMTYAQELDDLERGLTFARLTRAATGSGHGKMILGGFSRGGHLAYTYAGRESQLPHGKRHVRGLVPLDVYARVAPEDDVYRQNACISAYYEKLALADGVVDSDNGFQIKAGELASTAPDDPTPFGFFSGLTNREVLLVFMGQTYFFFQPTPVYHLAGTTLDQGFPTSLGFSTEPVLSRWLTASPFHSALAEAADTDVMWCGEEPPPVEDHLEDITVPIFYLGAAGGFGDHGIYSTTLTASSDVTTHVVRLLPAAQEEEDFGHGDLLYSPDAVDNAWEPLADWIRAH